MSIEQENDDDDELRIQWWQHWALPAGLGMLCLALSLWVWALHGKNAERLQEIATLKQLVELGPMLPPSRVRSIKVMPNRAGPGGAAQLSLALPDPPELIELHFNVSFAKQNTFRVLVERKDQARAGAIHNLLRDSNGEIHLAVNTSVLYPGTYQLTIEGLRNRANPARVGWVTIEVRK